MKIKIDLDDVFTSRKNIDLHIGRYTYDVHFEEGGGGGGKAKQDVIGRRRGGWICSMTRRHAEPNMNISLTGNLPFDSDVRQ